MGFEVEVNALKSDAKAWSDASTALEAPKQAIAPLTLNGADDVMGLGERMGIDDSYEKARSGIENMLGQAMEYFNTMSSSLTAVATDYEQMEQGNVVRQNSIQTPGGN
jgi:hypothetical protein